MSLTEDVFRQSTLPVRLHGVDGQVWDLLHPHSPVWIVDGFSGLHMPEIQAQASTFARVPGRKWRGRTFKPRTVAMQIHVGDQQPPFRTGQAWRELDADFWDSLPIGSDTEVKLEVGNRFLMCRLEESPAVMPKDPAIRGSQKYNLELVADRPFWREDDAVYPFVYDSESANYYGGISGVGPPFLISAGSVFAQAVVVNTGDVDAFVRWDITGPGTIVVGVDEDRVPMPFPLDAGQVIRIDSDPLKQTITDSAGNNLWPLMGASRIGFSPIPARSSKQLYIDVDAPGPGTSVIASFSREFFRAWGKQ